MQHILLLHGAIGAKDQLQSLAGILEEHYHVHSMNFSGHGGEPFQAGAFSIASFAGNVLDYMKMYEIDRAHIFGYSMGGYVGMYLARHYPEKVSTLVTLATKFHWSESVAANEVKMLNPDTIRQKIPAFATQLQQRHAPGDWTILLHKTKELLLQLGADNTLKPVDYSQLTVPVLVLLGDRDKMVTMEETVAVYKSIPKGQLGILPGTPHPLEQTDSSLLASFIFRFSGIA